LNLEFRVSDPEKDAPILVELLMEPGILRWFPMNDRKEVEESVKSWLAYSRIGASITIEKDGKPIGFSNLYLTQHPTLKHQSLFSIIVDQKARGQGIGRKTIEYMSKLAKETFHIKVLHLEVYYPNPAKRLYERFGFKQYGTHPAFLKEDDGTYRDKEMMQLKL